MARHQATTFTPLTLKTAPGKKWLGAARQSRGAQDGNGVGHAAIIREESHVTDMVDELRFWFSDRKARAFAPVRSQDQE